jgi:DNA-binding response OmpR family regulator
MVYARRILIVDDEPDITDIFKLAIESSDSLLKVDAFNDPSLALANYKPGLYDLIMLDVYMPQMNGVDLCKKIKSIDSNAKVCFITASEPLYDDRTREEIFFKVDKDLIIQKPVSVEELEDRINKLLVTRNTNNNNVNNSTT